MNSLPDLTPESLRIESLARAETIPSSWYTHPGFHEFDRQHVLLNSWRYVGHVSRIPNVGDYLTASVADNPVVVVRSAEDEIRAYYNVCRHRGGPLAMDACGHATMLKCQYHGWTYRLDGMLRGVPQFDRTELFDKKDYGLIPINVRAWQGLLFVNLQDEPAVELETLLGGITERIAPARLDGLQYHSSVVYDIACNWKVYVDNYLEGYHVPLVHPELCDVLDYRAYVTEAHDYYSLQYSPFRQPDDGNPYGIPDGEAYYYCVFPNFMLNILPGRLQVNLVIPVAHDRCRVVFDNYYTDVTSAESLRRIADDIEFSDRVQQEDIDICEHVQRGLASQGYDRGRFSVECEEGVYHFQYLLKTAYAQAVAADTELHA